MVVRPVRVQRGQSGENEERIVVEQRRRNILHSREFRFIRKFDFSVLQCWSRLTFYFLEIDSNKSQKLS